MPLNSAARPLTNTYLLDFITLGCRALTAVCYVQLIRVIKSGTAVLLIQFTNFGQAIQCPMIFMAFLCSINSANSASSSSCHRPFKSRSAHGRSVCCCRRPVTPVEAGVRSLEFDTATCWQKTRCLVLSPSSCASHRPPERADNESGAVQNPFDRGERDLEVRDILQLFFNRGSSPTVIALSETP